MKLLQAPWPGPGAATRQWLMLPGAYMRPQDFLDHGFVDALHARGLRHDVALLDADITRMADGSALRRLQEVLSHEVPAGRPVHLLGISLGAHLAMACLSQGDAASRRVDGAMLLAPYLGPREVWGEVLRSGLAAWDAQGADADIDRRIWHWLQRGGDATRLHLGYGAHDRFAAAHGLMAQALPPAQVDVQPGAHEWPVWSLLWRRHVEQIHDD